MLIESYKHGGLTVEIHTDDGPESPREWDNAGKLVIYGNGNHVSVNELGGTYFPTQDYGGWDELDRAVLAAFPGAELLPVYRYEHSSVAYNTTGFAGRAQHAEWDSCRVGFILCTRETIISEWGKKIASKSAREKARRHMAGEIETYSQWANGEVYGYVIKDEHGDDLDGDFHDSCWGFYGLDYCKQEAESSAESIAPKWFAGAVSRAAAALNDALEQAGQQRLAM